MGQHSIRTYGDWWKQNSQEGIRNSQEGSRNSQEGACKVTSTPAACFPERRRSESIARYFHIAIVHRLMQSCQYIAIVHLSLQSCRSRALAPDHFAGEGRRLQKENEAAERFWALTNPRASDQNGEGGGYQQPAAQLFPAQLFSGWKEEENWRVGFILDVLV